jgi:predicted RNA-binding protein with PUA-like domain
MRYWLMKTEHSASSIDDVLAMPDRTVPWWGVRDLSVTPADHAEWQFIVTKLLR